MIRESARRGSVGVHKLFVNGTIHRRQFARILHFGPLSPGSANISAVQYKRVRSQVSKSMRLPYTSHFLFYLQKDIGKPFRSLAAITLLSIPAIVSLILCRVVVNNSRKESDLVKKETLIVEVD